ncbi:unnamed protein product [Cyprideis torosa]|uniref:S-adenosylmethionine synthase n=1 Tax=Cyprideis torosa TaxID=163714 RepID=A0A7R8ZJS0_9CRUS|nr:unnamed protein product [Cyprideis torosa]CAG0878771.1 unnamed protein product [Cyprideis torosa]
MARGINKVILVGNVGQDPEVRFMPSGGAVTNLSVATSDSWTDKQTGQRQDRTEWHRVSMFNKLAEIAAALVLAACFEDDRPAGRVKKDAEVSVAAIEKTPQPEPVVSLEDVQNQQPARQSSQSAAQPSTSALSSRDKPSADLCEGLIDDKRRLVVPAMDKPPAGEPYIDPAFGTKVIRISDSAKGEVAKPMYSTIQAWNADESYIILYHTGSATEDPGHHLYDGSSYKHLRRLDIVARDIENVFWHHSDPDILFYLSAYFKYYGQLVRYNVKTNKKTVLASFDQYCGREALPTMGNDVMMQSWDDDTFGFRCNDGAGQETAFIFHPSTGKTYSTPLGEGTSYVPWFAPMPTPSGNLMRLNGDILDATLKNRVHSLDLYEFHSHSSIGQLANGHDALFATAFDPSPGGCDGGPDEGSVSEGHPDKMADQISDAVLDAILKQDKAARVACETMVKTGLVVIAGEVTTSAWVDLENLVRNTVLDIGYDGSDVGFDGATCAVLNGLGKQSPDIAQGVDRTSPEEQGAGDQGLMFGYATNETDVLMPAPITYSHRLVQRQAEVRKSGLLNWLRPDAKSQVTLKYSDGKPVGIDAVVLSTQHSPDVSLSDLQEGVMELILKPVLPAQWLDGCAAENIHINPTGNFVIGGPVGDCGLTGRKIIVDTYGGMARHGGGAFSGKDPSKVDRSAAYAGRYVAKNIVAAGLADKCEIQVSYAIGVARPTSISIETFGTGKVDDRVIEQIVGDVFDLRPYGIVKMLDLVRPIYKKTAAYGHFGREEPEFTWEKTDKVDALRQAAGV